ncbi:uncharacterized protein ACBT44_003853 isoform 2-T2 [Syngnathus typhle]
MGNLQLTTGLFTTGAPPPQPDSRFTSRPISRGITYYQACQPSSTSSATHDPLHATLSSRASPSPRPLLLFFSWLGAHPGAAAKYFDAFLARGMDVLLVQSGVMHFLWPRWGQNYALEVLKVLDRPEFSGRPFLVYASSIGGYTFTQVLVHVAHGHAKHATLPHRVVGHIYDSLVAGTLEHMATGDNIQQVESVLNEEMKKNKMWFDWNKLSLNAWGGLWFPSWSVSSKERPCYISGSSKAARPMCTSAPSGCLPAAPSRPQRSSSPAKTTPCAMLTPWWPSWPGGDAEA